MKSLILILFLSMNNLIPNKEALRLIEEKEGKEIFEFKENKAISYVLKDESFLILPHEGDSSIYFNSKKAYETFLKNPIWPKPKYDPFYIYRDLLTDIRKNLNYFCQILSSELAANISPIKSEEDLKLLFNLINQHGKDKITFYDKLIIPLGILIGEYLRTKHNLRWGIHSIYTFDKYDIPILKNKLGIHFSLWPELEEYFKKGKFDFDDFLSKRNFFDLMVETNSVR